MTKIILVPSPLNAAWNNNTNNFTEVKCFIFQTLKKLFQEAWIIYNLWDFFTRDYYSYSWLGHERWRWRRRRFVFFKIILWLNFMVEADFMGEEMEDIEDYGDDIQIPV